MFVIKALKVDNRFKEGLVYADATLQSYQRDSQITPTTPFPLDLEIDEIAITIEERSDDYAVGEKAPPPRVFNRYARDNSASVIRTMGRRNDDRKLREQGGYQTYKNNKKDMTKVRNT